MAEVEPLSLPPLSFLIMLKELIKIKEGIIDILWPRMCLGCSREGQYICKDCEIFLSEVNIFEVGLRTKIMSVWEYEGLMEKLIQKIKYDGCYDIINELIDKAFEKIELNLPANAHITYVPMCAKKEKQLGFNPAELIAKGVGSKINRPVVELLKKVKNNYSQAGLNPQERIENIKGALGFREESACPVDVLIVDDFLVSGATMKECFEVLRRRGAKNIWGFTLARTI